MLIQKACYIISAEHLQGLIMDDLYFMHYYYHEYAQSEEQPRKDVAYSNYKRNRALLRRMLHLQGLSDEESLMVRKYLGDLEDAILNGAYKMH